MLFDSLIQAATIGPGDINRPMLDVATLNGDPMPLRSASIALLSAQSPTTLLCLPHPVKILHQQWKNMSKS